MHSDTDERPTSGQLINSNDTQKQRVADRQSDFAVMQNSFSHSQVLHSEFLQPIFDDRFTVLVYRGSMVFYFSGCGSSTQVKFVTPKFL